MRVSHVVPSEAEIAVAEKAMRDGLTKEQLADMEAYDARERAKRLRLQSKRQARYNREAI